MVSLGRSLSFLPESERDSWRRQRGNMPRAVGLALLLLAVFAVCACSHMPKSCEVLEAQCIHGSAFLQEALGE